MKSKRVSPSTSSLILTKLINYNRPIRATSLSRKAGKLCQKTDHMIHMLKEKREQPIHSKRVQPTQESGSVDLEMAMENNSGQMVPDMKVNGKTIGHMAKESSLT